MVREMHDYSMLLLLPIYICIRVASAVRPNFQTSTSTYRQPMTVQTKSLRANRRTVAHIYIPTYLKLNKEPKRVSLQGGWQEALDLQNTFLHLACPRSVSAQPLERSTSSFYSSVYRVCCFHCPSRVSRSISVNGVCYSRCRRRSTLQSQNGINVFKRLEYARRCHH